MRQQGKEMEPSGDVLHLTSVNRLKIPLRFKQKSLKRIK
jgi:hypothetical protein